MQGGILGLAAADDPERAIDWLNAQPATGRRSDLVNALVAQLGTMELATAERMIASLPEEDRGNAGLSLWSARAATDPEGAAAWLESLESSSDNFGSANYQVAPIQILSVLGMTSNAAAERFMAALSDEQRTRLEPTYIKTLARNDPQLAARRLAEVTDPQQYSSAARSLVQTWARDDPKAASRWIESQPSQSGADVNALYNTLGRAWTRNDPDGATSFARRMLSGTDRDHLLGGMLGTGRVNGKDARSLLNLIDDPTLRAQSEKLIERHEQARSQAARLQSLNTN